MQEPGEVVAFQAPDGVEVRHLRAFVAVAKELNFSRAAEQLYVSPRGAMAFSTPTSIGYVAPPHGGGPAAYTELDSGDALWGDSLWAYDEGHRLYWRNDGVRKSASWR